MKEKQKERYKLMGQIVTVSAFLERRIDEALKVEWIEQRLDSPRAGWVVGFRVRQIGKVHNGGTDWETGYSDPNYLEVTGVIKTLLICYWPTLSTVDVLESSVTLGGEPDNRHAKWPEEWKERARKEARENPLPRLNGRFAKFV